MNPLLLPELITLVADYFDPDDATAPSLVCRVWNAAFGPIVWRSYLIDTKTHSKQYVVPGLVRNAPHIRQMICKDVSSIGQFLIPCTKLTDLAIWQDYRGELTDADPVECWDRFSQLIHQNPRLSKLTISVSGTSSTEEFWAAISPIARIDIAKIQMGEQDIHTFWKGCKNIHELRIDSIRPMDNIEFFTGAQESVLYANLKRIAVLDRLRDAPAASLVRFLSRKQCPHLTSLTLACPWLIPRSTVRSFIAVLEQGCLPLLEDLTLTHNILDAELSSCLSALNPLLHLNCAWSKFGPQALAALDSHFASLKTLQLSECPQVTGEMIQKVLESCPMLIELLANEIHAPQIQQGRPWVCLGLKRFSVCVIVDSRTAKNVRKQSQAVFEQLGRLTRLEVLTVGTNKHDGSRVSKFQGLDFRLESGMDQLVGLTRLEKLSFMRTKQNMSCQDVAWMRRHLWRLVMVRGRCNMYGDYREQPV